MRRHSGFHPLRLSCSTILALLAFGGAVHADCPVTTLQVNGLPNDQFAGGTASGTRYVGGSTVGFNFRDYGDTFTFSVAGEYAQGKLTVRGRYRVLGIPAGTWVDNAVRVPIRANLNGAGGDPYCSTTWGAVSLYHNGAGAGGGSWTNLQVPPPGEGCRNAASLEASFICSHPAGEEFDLTTELAGFSNSFFSGVNLGTSIRFGALPPGAFIVRCNGSQAQVVGVGPRAPASLRIEGVWPNPAHGEFRAALTAANATPAQVRLIDVNGRLIESRVWDAAVGERRELAFGRTLAPGTYFLQVRQGVVSDVCEVVVLR